MADDKKAHDDTKVEAKEEPTKPGRNPARTETAPSFEEIKTWVQAWVRHELHLVSVGVPEEARKERNP